jgi:hypothetical protein
MKTVAALCATLLLCACGSTGIEDPPDINPPPEGASLEELETFAQKVAIMIEPAGLIVVGKASVIVRRMDVDPSQFFTISNGDGHQRATWVDNQLVTSWSHDCWTGVPTFPGSTSWSPCGTIQGPFQLLERGEILEKTRSMVLALAGMEGYQMLWSSFFQDGGVYDYELWYADPDDRVFYWRWQEGLAAGS